MNSILKISSIHLTIMVTIIQKLLNPMRYILK